MSKEYINIQVSKDLSVKRIFQDLQSDYGYKVSLSSDVSVLSIYTLLAGLEVVFSKISAAFLLSTATTILRISLRLEFQKAVQHFQAAFLK